MSEPENFLSRWSRRKLEAEQPKDAPHAAPPTEAPDVEKPNSGDTPAEASQTGAPIDKEEPEFDVSALPSIDSITSATDVRVFLQKGVPADLTRAALRRAWTADPAIRDFIGIAENQYDFATGSDIPGFGALDAGADEIRRLVAEVFGEGLRPGVETETKIAGKPETVQASEVAGRPTEPTPNEETASTAEDQPIAESQAPAAQDVVQRNEVNIAMQQSSDAEEYKPQPVRRPHGRALPQ